MAVIKKPVRKIVKISDLKQNQSEVTKEYLEEQTVMPEQTIQESELLKRNNIILQQQTLLDQLADNNLKDQVVYLDPVKDQEVVEQLSELRKYQSVDQENQNIISSYTDESKSIIEDSFDGTKIKESDTLNKESDTPTKKLNTLKGEYNDSSTSNVGLNGVSPYAIYYEDYLAQLEIEKSIQPTSDDLKKMSYYDGNKTYGDDYSNLDIPDLEQCIDEGTWRDRLFWKFVINEDRYWDLTYILIKFALGPLESFLNWFLHKIKSVKIVGWYPFKWVKYTKFAEQFQYNVAKKYDSMFCGTPTFYKNYTGDKYGLAQFLNDL